jgi:hypothetical protein
MPNANHQCPPQKGYKVPTGLAGGSQTGVGKQTITSIPR